MRGPLYISCAAPLLVAVACTTPPDAVVARTAAVPPSPPANAPVGDRSAPVAFAMTRLFIGSTDRHGVEDASAWAIYGYDLHGEITATDLRPHCLPSANAFPKDAFADGLDGRENAFGKKLVPMLDAAAPPKLTLQQEIDVELGHHAWTLIFALSGLGPGRAYSAMDASLFVGEGGAGDTWNARPEYLAGAALGTPAIAFPHSYLVAKDLATSTWVSNDRAALPLHLEVGGMHFDFVIHVSVVTMDLDAGHTRATNGTIAGVLDTEEVVAEVRRRLPEYSLDLCTGQAAEAVLDEVRRASDVMSDGTQDGAKACNGISIGLGFDASPVTVAAVGPAASPYTSPCPP